MARWLPWEPGEALKEVWSLRSVACACLHVSTSHCGREALTSHPAHSPFQCGDTFMPASGSPGGKASTGLPGPIPMPRLVLSLPPALRVPAVIGLCPGRERGNLKAIIEDAESKLAVSLRQREQVLVHTLWRGRGEAAMYHRQRRGEGVH